MQSTTLQGIFPEPKTTYRRNFIKENVKSIKQMQEILQEAGVIQPRPPKEDKFRNVPHLAQSRDSSPNRGQSQTSQEKIRFNRSRRPAFRSKMDKKKEKTDVTDSKFTHRSMQTEITDDLTKLYETGVIKYPSPYLTKANQKTFPNKLKSIKSISDGIEDELQSLGFDEKDFVRENISKLRTKTTVRQPSSKVPNQPPPTYQRGVLPKYLRERKEEDSKEENEDELCREGHVLLPEEERKETLRVLRESYAERIQELNSMPVRSDTLRLKKRKMEIEEELKRIDGGIKVFQRPKVYVKINA